MRYSLSTALLFFLCTFLACIWLKVVREGTSSPLQLAFFAMSEESLRAFLSLRLGTSLDIFAIIAAAAPLDYILNKGSPSWRLLGVGPCDKRRIKLTKLGSCAPLQAHACYLYGAIEKDGFERMATCYEILQVSTRDAQKHTALCHPEDDMAWSAFKSCWETKKEFYVRTERSANILAIMVNCAQRHDVVEQWIELMKGTGRFNVEISSPD